MLFESLDQAHAEEIETRTRQAATIASYQRAIEQFGQFLGKSRNSMEREARLNVVDTNLREAVHSACLEHGYADSEKVYDEIRTKLAMPDNAQNAGDSYAGQSVDPEKQIGNSPAGARGRNFKVDEDPLPESKDHPRDNQNIEEKADWEADWKPSDADNRPVKHVDADETIGDTEAIKTKTFPKGNQATPVSSKVWHVVSDFAGQDALPAAEEFAPGTTEQSGANMDALMTLVQGIAADLQQIKQDLGASHETADQLPQVEHGGTEADFSR